MSEWRYDLDEVGEDAEGPDERVEPGRIALENALFVVLGAVAMVVAALLVMVG